MRRGELAPEEIINRLTVLMHLGDVSGFVELALQHEEDTGVINRVVEGDPLVWWLLFASHRDSAMRGRLYGLLGDEGRIPGDAMVDRITAERFRVDERGRANNDPF